MKDLNFGHEITDTYDVVGEIGKGGGGTVYEAYHKRLRKKVVLKKQHDAIRGLVNERTETDTLKNLRHSNLPQVLDFIVTNDSVYTVMDYIPGQSVKDILKEKGKLSEDEVIKYAQQLCDALVYLHNSKPPVIHGDIKPDNIMITPEGDVCLIDFNISSALGAANSYAFGYTLGYAAPEQRRSFEYERGILKELKATGVHENVVVSEDTAATELLAEDATELLEDNDSTELLTDSDATELLRDEVVSIPRSSTDMTMEEKREIGILFDKRSDIYSFGATLYHMLTGTKPSSDPDKIKSVLEIYPMMNRGLADIITKSMYIDPEDRYQSFDEIKKILNNIRKYDLKYRAKVIRRIIIVAVSAVILGIVAAISLIYLKRTGEKKYRNTLDEALEQYYGAEYESSIETINTKLLDTFYFDMDKGLSASTYLLRGNDYFSLEQYDYAIEDYDIAITLDPNNTQIYRDKAIALSRAGRSDEAIAVIESARGLDIKNADLLLANAEIEAARGNKEAAKTLYSECANTSDDAQTKVRAYMLCATLYDRNDVSELREAIELLIEASNIESGLKASAMEQLAQCYINLSEISGDRDGYDNALNVFDQICGKGWDTYTTHNNMAIIYEQEDDLDAAEYELNLMIDRYGDNYNTYKRLAFLEIEKQNKIVGDIRDYTAFTEYCDRAFELYQKQGIVTDDMEMNVLTELKGQVQ